METKEIVMYRLRHLRERHKLTTEDVAKVIGRTRQSYSRYETGECQLNYEQLVALSKFYKVSTDYLLGLDTDKLVGDVTAMTDNQLDKALIQSYMSMREDDKQVIRNYILEIFERITELENKEDNSSQPQIVEEPKPPIMQSKPQQVPQPMQIRQAGPVQQPPPQMVQKRKSILPKPQTIDEPRRIVKDGKVYEEVRYVAHDKSGNSNFGTLWVNEEDLKNAETDDYSKYD